MTAEEKGLIEKLIVDQKTILRRLVEQAQGIVGIDRDSGDAVILASRSKLTDREQIFLMLLGKYFSNRLGKSKTESFTVDEIAEKLGLTTKAVSARLSDLKRERLVETIGRGEYRIVYANAESVLSSIAEKLES